MGRNAAIWRASAAVRAPMIGRGPRASTSKLSSIETGQGGASAEDIRDLCDLYEVDDGNGSVSLNARAKTSSEPDGNLRLPSTYVG